MNTPDSLAAFADANSTVHFSLATLFVSPGNVRRTEPKHIEQLGAMILSQGLLHALHVTAEKGSDGTLTGCYAVEAGGRRLRALQWLHLTGKIAANFPVECRLIKAENACTVSLIENISQEAMHPADEFEAIQTLVTAGGTVELIAAQLGVTVVHVQRRLKMANVAPALVALYRQNEMTLDQVMALATVDDQERQLLVWNGLSSYSRSAATIKRKLVEDEVEASDVRVRIVGLDSYIAAGGVVRADLFSDEGAQYLLDPGLLEMLMGERVEEQALAVRSEGWAWVEVITDYGYQERQMFRAQSKRYFPETAEIEAERVAFEAALLEIDAANDIAQEAQEWDESELLDEQYKGIEAQIDALMHSRLDSADVDKSTLGAVLCLVGEEFVVHRGLIRRSDEKQSGLSGDGGVSGKPVRAEVPEKLMLDLSSHRTAAIQAAMITNPQVTLAALAHRMAVSTFGKYQAGSSIKINLTQNRRQLEKNSLSLSQSRAALALDAELETWTQRLPENSDAWFAWLLEQPQVVILSLIVFATANCADALQHQLGSNDDAAPIAHALALDMSDWWQASPSSYLELVPKSKLIEVVTETAGAQVANEMLKMKKPLAVSFAASHIAGKRWLPPALRTRKVTAADVA